MGKRRIDPNENPEFKGFATSLARTIAKYPKAKSKDDATQILYNSLVELIDLETQFREKLTHTIMGHEAYEKFITWMKENKKNVLSAQPFFRCRQEEFKEKVSSQFIMH